MENIGINLNVGQEEVHEGLTSLVGGLESRERPRLGLKQLDLLTPEGAKKLGVEVDEPLLVLENAGFYFDVARDRGVSYAPVGFQSGVEILSPHLPEKDFFGEGGDMRLRADLHIGGPTDDESYEIGMFYAIVEPSEILKRTIDSYAVRMSRNPAVPYDPSDFKMFEVERVRAKSLQVKEIRAMVPTAYLFAKEIREGALIESGGFSKEGYPVYHPLRPISYEDLSRYEEANPGFQHTRDDGYTSYVRLSKYHFKIGGDGKISFLTM